MSAESIFTSAIETAGAENSQTDVPLMTRIEFVYGLIKVALRSADDAVRNVSELACCGQLAEYHLTDLLV